MDTKPSNWNARGGLEDSARTTALEYINQNGNIIGCDIFESEESRVHSFLVMTQVIAMTEERGKYVVTHLGEVKLSEARAALMTPKAGKKPEPEKKKTNKPGNKSAGKPATAGAPGTTTPGSLQKNKNKSDEKENPEDEPKQGELIPPRVGGKLDTKDLALATVNVMEGLLKGDIPVDRATQYSKLLDGVINLKKTELAVALAEKEGITVGPARIGS